MQMSAVGQENSAVLDGEPGVARGSRGRRAGGALPALRPAGAGCLGTAFPAAETVRGFADVSAVGPAERVGAGGEARGSLCLRHPLCRHHRRYPAERRGVVLLLPGAESIAAVGADRLLVGVIRSYFTPERTRRLLLGRREWLGNVLAGLLGTVTPFCSCSAVPLFIGFVTAGVPLGVTLSFLISAPMVNEVALVLLFGLFGWRVAALYLATGLGIAILAGWIIGRLHPERQVESWVYDIPAGAEQAGEVPLDAADRVRYGLQAVRETLGRVWPFILAGIAVGAALHGYMPEGTLAAIMGKRAWWSVPAAVLLGIPIYTNAAGIIPIVQVLLEKGAALGTVLAFMMSVIALSLPELILLRQILKPRLLVVFVGVVSCGILLVGYLFNLMLKIPRVV